MKTLISENKTKALTKVLLSWSFLWFIIYCILVVITVGLVSFGIAYFTDYFFHTGIISGVEKITCGVVGGMTCAAEQLAIKIMTSPIWPIIVIPITIAVVGSWKYDRKSD